MTSAKTKFLVGGALVLGTAGYENAPGGPANKPKSTPGYQSGAKA